MQSQMQSLPKGNFEFYKSWIPLLWIHPKRDSRNQAKCCQGDYTAAFKFRAVFRRQIALGTNFCQELIMELGDNGKDDREFEPICGISWRIKTTVIWQQLRGFRVCTQWLLPWFQHMSKQWKFWNSNDQSSGRKTGQLTHQN